MSLGLVMLFLLLSSAPASQTQTVPIVQDPRFQQAKHAYENGSRERACALLRSLCQETPENGLNWLAAADFLRQQDDYSSAIEFAEQANQLVPHIDHSFLLLGICYTNLQRLREAEEVFRRAVQRFPENAVLLFNMGKVLALNEKFLEAVKYFEEAIKRDSGNAIFLLNAGKIWFARNRYDQAEKMYRAAATVRPGHPDAPWRLAHTLSLLDRQQEAERWYKRALRVPEEKLHSWTKARFHYAVFLYEGRNFEKALVLLEEVLSRDPKERMSWNYKARCQKALGLPQEALRSQKRYQELQKQADQEDAERLKNLGLHPKSTKEDQ